MTQPIPFRKYEQLGAYHWEQCDRRSKNYNPPLEARYEVVVRAVRALRPVQTVLDVGCGDGYLMSRLSGLAERVDGVDSEARAIALAKECLSGLPNCHPQQGSSYQLPFPDRQFDVVTFTDVVEHLDEPATALSEIRRAIKPGGHLVLTTPKYRPDRMWDPLHVHEFTPDELRAALTAHFKEVTLRYFWPMPWSRFYSTRLGWRLAKYYARWVTNPFVKESAQQHEHFGQIMAVCK